MKRLEVDPTRGLSDADAARRLREHGPNELVDSGRKSRWRILWEQLTGTMVVILIIAAAVSAALGDYKDAVAIAAIVILNALLGFSQEYRAEEAMAALKRLAVPTVKVRRDGHVREISSRDLVPGDLVLLEPGNLVPADGRLIEAVNLRVQEAALTGESEPVEKNSKPTAGEDLPLGDRLNMVYMGTVVTYGRGLAAITATGMATELGRIATMIQAAGQEPTPLQRRLDRLGRQLAAVALGIVGVFFVLGLLRGEDLRLIFLTAVSMAVAAVPEGLPAVVTIALALGAQRMLKRQALIRRLPAVETLGSVTIICSDKTGTLTENHMTVTVLDAAGDHVELGGPVSREGAPARPGAESLDALREHPGLTLLLAGSALCNDAVLEADPTNVRIVGDPTEAALLDAAARCGLGKDLLEQTLPRVAELPFDSERKRMTTVHAIPASSDQIPEGLAAAWDWKRWTGSIPYVAFTKGAVDGLLQLSPRVWVGGETEPTTGGWDQRISAENDRLAQNGMRVLGLALRSWDSLPTDEERKTLERDLTFVGLVAMIDPPRAEARAAVQTCREAGIRPVMITGDHPLTAGYIARELGIAANGRIVTGQDLDGLPDTDLAGTIDDVSVFARVSPEHKLKIVDAFRSQGHIVAMTGDGVNDAPALKKADIGVSMGITGTDVAKEAADMVLLDDNFATIVAAIEEGRVIYDNIRKFVKYLMTTNSGELCVMLLAPFLGMPLPLLPLQILWINLVTDGPTALALSVEPAERGTMQRPPYAPDESLLARGLARHIIWVGGTMALVSLGVGFWYWRADHPAWQTMIFTTLVVAQLGHVLGVRSSRDSLFKIGLSSNRLLLAAVLLTLGLQLAVIYVPILQTVLQTKALAAWDLLVSVGLGALVLLAVEIEKWLIRRQAER